MKKNGREYLDGSKEKGKESWGHFTVQAVRMKIIDPSQDLGISEKEWQGMREKLEYWREQENWGRFGDQAMLMKIISSAEREKK